MNKTTVATDTINVPNDMWKEIVKYCNVTRLEICTEYDYGKLLGGNLYAGYPIMLDIKINVNSPDVYIMQTANMYITDDLDIIYNIDNLGGVESKDAKLKDKELTKLLDNVDSTDVLMFGIGHDDDDTFGFGSTFIKLDQDQITTFMNRYIAVLKEFQAKCRQLMIDREKTINPDGKMTGFYAN